MEWLWLVLMLVGALVLYSLTQGAPYVPTRASDAEAAMKLLDLPKGSTVIDIGCGDGIVLKKAAEHGYCAVGIEINPFLWVLARWRCRKYRAVKVIWGNVWHWHVPAETSAVFVFSAGPFMRRLSNWLQREAQQLHRPLKVVSLGFGMPGFTVARRQGPLSLYVVT